MNRQLILQLWYRAYLKGEIEEFNKFEKLLSRK